ncbi:MAG: alpha/beta hydrolase [Terracidiphilus sp.]
MKQCTILIAAAAVFAATGLAQPAQPAAAWPPPPDHPTIAVWPGTPPGAKANMPPEEATKMPGMAMTVGWPYIQLSNVSAPAITLYTPKGNNTGAAVVVFPGGGYNILAIDLEGTEVCDWLSRAGVTCVLLKYRVPGTGPYPKSAAALQDAQRAIGLVRLHASEWGIDPHRVGVLGFSAGAYLSAALSSNYANRLYEPVDDADKLSCRPDFSVVLYPGYLALEDQNFALSPGIHPTPGAPPTFILQAENDPAHVENAVVYFMALKNAGAPAELHVYAEGGHGYGLRPRDFPIMGWPKLVETWLHTIKMLSPE